MMAESAIDISRAGTAAPTTRRRAATVTGTG
jgi:hypothetical protein